ncbi:MAG: NADH-quinone oxidoreductase subunit H [Gammaproteobacteria bacterium]|nr:NADH-quinone oxidoreductase subunit H [Gammaproteobacteria bacterium]
MAFVIKALLFIILAPVVGCLITGFDRIITARLQGRFGPPLLQPFYDVMKLFAKENLVVRHTQNLYIIFYLIFMVFTGVLFFTGGDILLTIFAFTLAAIFFVLAAFKGSSPFSHVGAHRELIQIMAYEPMILFCVIGMGVVAKSFYVADIASFPKPLLIYLPGMFIGLLYVLTIKLRKSPFDLSTSHHAHQEIVKGITTEYSGSAMALIEIAHWYETVLILGLVYLFFATIPVVGVIIALLAYFFEIVIDNAFARTKWLYTLKSSWVVTLVFAFGNFLILEMFLRG